MMVLIFVYVLGLVLTSLLIRYSDEELRANLQAEPGALTTALLAWPVFLLVYTFVLCRRLTKIK